MQLLAYTLSQQCLHHGPVETCYWSWSESDAKILAYYALTHHIELIVGKRDVIHKTGSITTLSVEDRATAIQATCTKIGDVLPCGF